MLIRATNAEMVTFYQSLGYEVEVTDFTLRDPPVFNEGDHPISRKGPTLFQVVPKRF